MKKVAKWLGQISLYCRLVQNDGVNLMCQLTKEMAQGAVNFTEWEELMRNTWFIVDNDVIVQQCGSQWECVETSLDGEFFPAKILIQDVLGGRKHIRQAGL